MFPHILALSLAALGSTNQDPSIRPLPPAETLALPPATVAWGDLLRQIASSGAVLVEGEVTGTPLEIQPLELPAPALGGALRVHGRSSRGEQRSTSCSGFADEPALGQSFDAQLDVPDDAGLSHLPPDVAGSVGPQHLMAMLNNRVLVQDRLGGAVASMDLATFWSPLAAASTTYPRLHYDALAGRWIASARSGTGGAMQVLLAVSQTSDPTGAWDYYALDADPLGATFPDWLLQGSNATWIALTANMFTVAGGTFAGAKMWVVDRATIGGTLAVNVFPTGFMSTVHGSGGSSPHPARALDSADPDLWLLNDSLTSGGTFLLQLTRISGTGAAPVVSGLAGSPFGGTSSLCYTSTNWSGTQRALAQVGDARFISVLSTRIASAVERNGKLWAVNSGGLPGPSSNSAPASTGVLWRQLDPALPFPAFAGEAGTMLVQDGALTGGADTMACYPSIAVNCAEDVLIGFSSGDATRNPECSYAVRLGTDAPGSMGPIRLLQAGLSSYWKNSGAGTTAPWGRYSSCAVDPNDDVTLWTLQEYAGLRVGPADADSRWATRWGSLGSCGGTPVIVDAPDDLTVCAGDAATLWVVASASSGSLSYQWRKDGVPIPGAAADTLTLPQAAPADAGAYDVVVTDGCASTTSPAALLTVNAVPVITAQPSDQETFLHWQTTLAVIADGAPPLDYQWQKDGVPIPGANDSVYTFTPTSRADAGLYDVVVSNLCGSTLSLPAFVTISHNVAGDAGVEELELLAEEEDEGGFLTAACAAGEKRYRGRVTYTNTRPGARAVSAYKLPSTLFANEFVFCIQGSITATYSHTCLPVAPPAPNAPGAIVVLGMDCRGKTRTMNVDTDPPPNGGPPAPFQLGIIALPSPYYVPLNSQAGVIPAGAGWADRFSSGDNALVRAAGAVWKSGNTTGTVMLTRTSTRVVKGLRQKVISRAKVVVYQEPVADFTFTMDPPSGVAPVTVAFQNTSTGTIAGHSWDFEDGTSTQVNPVHVFTESGIYDVTLTVTSPAGTTASTTHRIIVW